MAFPTTGILDNFNRANAGTLGANWSVYWSNINWEINSNAARGAAVAWFGNYYNVATYGADAEVFITITQRPGADLELDVRIGGTPGSSPNSYACVFNDGAAGTHRIYRVSSGSGTVLGASFSQTLAVGDSIGLEVIGSTIKAYYKPSGGSWTELASRTDTTHSGAGYLAVSGLPDGLGTSAIIWDDFGGGTVVAGSGPVTVTPAAATAQGAVSNPAVQLGSLTIAPGALTAQGILSNPIVVNNVAVTPAVVTAQGSLADPTVVSGSLAIAPAAVTAATVLVDPTFVAGSLSIGPAAVTVTTALANPTVQAGGDTTVSPAAVTAQGALTNPTVVNVVVLTPAAVAIQGALANPAVVNPVTLAPAAVTVATSLVAPTVINNITYAPAAVTAATSLANVTFIAGSLSLGPVAVTVQGVLADPTVVLGSLVVTPAVVTVATALANPTVLIADAVTVVVHGLLRVRLRNDGKGTPRLSNRGRTSVEVH